MGLISRVSSRTYRDMSAVTHRGRNEASPPRVDRLYSVTNSPADQSFSKKATIAILCTFAFCMTNVIFLEHIVKLDPSAGNLVTFTQFLFASSVGSFTWWQFGRRKNQVPIKWHLLTVVLFWSVNFTNNLAFKYSIPMTLHTIFRSGSLVSNMLLGVLLMKKRYRVDKYVSVIFITIGIVLCTLMSKAGQDQKTESGESALGEQIMGISLLTFALLVSSVMGLIQETTYKRFGKHPSEALFIDHALGLPFFYFAIPSILQSLTNLANTAPVDALGGAPLGLVYLAANCITSYACIRSVFILTTECTSLTVTLVITVRKFLTLVVSIFYFSNPFTFYHWVGTAMVFLGAMVYADVVPVMPRKPVDQKKTE